MQINTDKYFVHSNVWWWGVSYNIICKDGSGIVELQFDKKRPSSCYVTGLSVEDSCRENGIGRMLLELCFDLARQEGKKFIELNVEYEPQWLAEWYVRMGFSVLYREDDTMCMIKVL